MKLIKLLLPMIFSISVFANYTLVFKNGAKLEIKNKPDFTKKIINVESLDGKKYIFNKNLIQIDNTIKFNQKIDKPKSVPKKNNEMTKKVQKVKKVKKENNRYENNEEVLVITDKNFIRNEKNKKDKKNTKQVYKNTLSESEETGSVVNTESFEPTDKEGNDKEFWVNIFKKITTKINVSKNKIKEMENNLSKLATNKLGSTDTMYIMQVSGKMDKLNEMIEKEKKILEKLKKEKNDSLLKAKRMGALPGWYRDYE